MPVIAIFNQKGGAGGITVALDVFRHAPQSNGAQDFADLAEELLRAELAG